MESALETVPLDLWNHRVVKQHSKKRGKHPSLVLLDRSYHHAAMKKLRESEKRGRPDIVHFSLLEALSAPLNKEGRLEVYVHTRGEKVITIDRKTRLPRNYNRFVGLIEQLFELRRVPSVGRELLKVESKTLPQLLDQIKTDYVLTFSREGSSKTIEEAVSTIFKKQRPTIMVGGFPKGQFLDTTVQLADEVVCVDPEMIDTWTLTSRVIYEYERVLSLPQKRLKQQ